MSLSPGQRAPRAQKDFLRSILQKKETAIMGAAIVLFIVFSLTSKSFLTPYNVFNLSRNLSFNVVIALSQATALVVGGLNLSVGAIGGLATITAGHILMNTGLPGAVAVIAALAVGVVCGFINGVLITKMKLNSFIVTLATSFIFTGLVYGISRGYPYTDIPKTFTFVGRGKFLFFPVIFWVMIITLIWVWYFYRNTITGRRILSTGSNEEASKLSGIKTDRMIIVSNILNGIFAALAGILYVSRMGSAQPATGQNWLVISFAVAIIGGTGLRGGSISALGIFAGGLIMVFIKNGLIMLEANVYFEQAFLGLIILLAVSLEPIQMLIRAGRRKK